MTQGKQQDRIAYLIGPVLADQGAGFYLVHRVNSKRLTYFVQETLLPSDEDDAYTMTEILADGKAGRVFTSPQVYADDIVYDISQTYENSYDVCRCGSAKAASSRRCPICRIERRERRKAFAKKVIAAYKRNLRKQAKAAKRAEKQAARRAAEQAEFDRLRTGPTLDDRIIKAAGKSRFAIGAALMAVTSMFARPAKEPVQMALPLTLE